MCHVMCSVSTLGNISADDILLFLIFPRKQDIDEKRNCSLGVIYPLFHNILLPVVFHV